MFGIIQAIAALFFGRTPSGGDQGEPGIEGQAQDTSKCTIIAIDDDPIILAALRGILSKEGYNVLTSASGAKGLDMLRYTSRDVRVVILDYNMPRLNGAETLHYLRKLNPQVKVIALTAVDLNKLPPGFHDGVDTFLPKPLCATTLIRAIDALLGTESPLTNQG